ncbi:MAG: hypothetical protein Q7N50_08440 [Armatimonadota bacterium]|nr:hypothetical protein [Armatimonadota bacterium]
MVAASTKVTFVDTLLRLKWLLWGLGILFVGVLLIWLGQTLSGLQSIFVETVGIGLLPIGSFMLIYEYGMRKDYQKLVHEELEAGLKVLEQQCSQCKKFGLLALNDKRESCNVVAPFEETKVGEVISVLGVALADLTAFDTVERILQAIQRGWRVRLLYLDPDCEEAKRHSLDEGRPQNEVAADIKGTENKWGSIINRLDQPSRGRLEIRKYRSDPKKFIMIHQDRVYVGDYLCDQRGNRCPHFLLEGDSPIAAKYKCHFEFIWQYAQDAIPELSLMAGAESP